MQAALFYYTGGVTYIATTRLMPLHIGSKRSAGTAIASIIDYIKNPEKTDNGHLITSFQCDSRMADSEFLYARQQYIRHTGKIRGKDDVIAYHLRQSFRPGEITPEEANRLGCELAKRFTKGDHAYVVCTHIDTAHIHNHIIWCATTLDEKRKFRNFWGSTKAVRRLNDTICIQNGYSIVENPKQKGKTYDRWLGDQKPLSHRERICYAIDDALAKNPDSFEAMLDLLRQEGYTIKDGEVPSLLEKEQKRFIRMDSLGEGYSPEALQAIISGSRKHIPKKRPVTEAPQTPSGSLLIDIQKKLQEGKGAGYAKWAKSFNLKQMSQTMIYLEENGLLDQAMLDEKAAAASSLFRALSHQMKEAEQRMTEIKILQQHIVNYSKTRNIYVGYRKAGYSKKYLSEHESDILLHKAAKQYFNEKGLEKLPTYKSLQEEYAAVMAKKKQLYSDYRKAREQMKALQTAKANVDRVLNMDIHYEETDRESSQR